MSGKPAICIHTPNAVQPHGHYSQAVRCGDLLFVSGILGNNDDKVAPLEQQVAACLTNMEAIVAAAGGDRRNIVKIGVFVTDVSLWPRINAQYAAFFGEHRPARIVVPCGPMRFNSLLEMDAVASL